MLTCQYCGGVITEGLLDCPHCGSSVFSSSQDTDQNSTPEPRYTIIPKYYKDLVFRQNLFAILVFAFALCLVYSVPAFILLALYQKQINIGLFAILVLLNYVLAYYLGILSMRAYFKKRVMAIKFLVYSTKIEYYSRAAKGMSKSVMGILNVDKISVKQSDAQKKYNVGTLILDLKFKMGDSKEPFYYTRKIKNIEQAEMYCEKIKGLKEAAKALVG